MARVRVLTMKFPRVTKIGQLIASMRTTPQVSGLGPVTVYIARFKCRAGLDPDRAYLFQLGSAHQKVAPGRARSTRLHCQLFCRAVLDPGRALSICGSVNVAYVYTCYRASLGCHATTTRVRPFSGLIWATNSTPVRSYLSYLWSTKFKIATYLHKFLIFRRTVQIAPNLLH